MMKQLAVQADERWKSIPSYLDAPAKKQPVPATGMRDSGGNAQAVPEGRTAMSAVKSEAEQSIQSEKVDEGARRQRTREREENPWKRAERGAPSENWQPQQWSPGVVQRKG